MKCSNIALTKYSSGTKRSSQMKVASLGIKKINWGFQVDKKVEHSRTVFAKTRRHETVYEVLELTWDGEKKGMEKGGCMDGWTSNHGEP